MSNDHYWMSGGRSTPSPTPPHAEVLANASYWESDYANTVYSTGSGSAEPARPKVVIKTESGRADDSRGGGNRRPGGRFGTGEGRRSDFQQNRGGRDVDGGRRDMRKDPRDERDPHRSRDRDPRSGSREMEARSNVKSDESCAIKQQAVAKVVPSSSAGQKTLPKREEPVVQSRDPRKSSPANPPAESRDPRFREPARKRSADGKYKTDIPSKIREPPPDRPDEITEENIELHRLIYENDHIWSLRKRFMLAHCNDIPANLLECFSQVFINMECDGTTYPVEVMKRVRELASHMSEELREIREKKKVKIAFVKAEEENEPKPEISKPKHVTPRRELRSNTSQKPKPIAFVKPTTGAELKSEPETKAKVEEEVETREEEAKPKVEEKARKLRPKKEVTKIDPLELELFGELTGEESMEEQEETETEDVAMETQEEVTKEVEEIMKEAPKKESHWKRMKERKKALSSGPASDKMAILEKNKKAFARNSCEEMVYDLAHALARIEKDGKAPKNPIEHLYMAASWSKQTLEFRFDGSSKSGQQCFVLLSNIVLGSFLEMNKKLAKRKAFERGLEKLGKVYLRVTRVNPERQELEASNTPFAGQGAAQNFAVLGGGEVARRGMKPTVRNPSKDDFILVDYVSHDSKNAANVLQQSADFNKVPIKWEYEENGPTVICKIFLDHDDFESCSGSTKQLAKLNAAEKALERLQKSNWTIKIKGQADTSTSGLSRDEVLGDLSKASDAIPESNVGSKLLKKMGWTGGGVGKSGQGISEPIKADVTLVRREGFGMSAVKGLGRDFKTKVKMTLQEYCRSQRQDDMRFSPEFSNEERAIVHTEARKLGLRSKSYGQGEERHLVVGRKRSAGQLFSHIMAQGGSTSKYELVAPPGSGGY